MGAKVSKGEIQAVEGAAGAKVGLSLAAQMDLLKAKTMAVPIILGGTAGLLLPGKETEKRVRDAIKFVKESSMDKATFVFEKLSKCGKSHGKKKKKMVKKAGAALAGTGLMLAIGFTPKPRKTVTGITNAKGKDLKMKDLVNLPKMKK